MKRFDRVALWCSLCCLFALGTGCGVIRDRSSDYVEEVDGAGVAVPDGYRNGSVRSAYPIPDINNNQTLAKAFNLPPPPDATLNILKEPFAIEVQEGNTWLLANEPPSRLWPSLERFFRNQGVSFDLSDPQKGLAQGVIRANSQLGKVFLTKIGLPDNKDSLVMIQLRQGIKRRSSEAQVRLVAPNAKAGFYAWDEVPPNLEVEKKLLEEAKAYLLDNRDRKEFSLLASDIGGPAKVSLVSSADHGSYLQLDLDFERAWSVVMRSVRNAGLPIADIDRSQGIVYLDVRENDEKCGFMGFFCSTDKEKPEYDYRLDVKSEGDEVKVFVVNMIASDDVEGQNRILSLLLENAS